MCLPKLLFPQILTSLKVSCSPTNSTSFPNGSQESANPSVSLPQVKMVKDYTADEASLPPETKQEVPAG